MWRIKDVKLNVSCTKHETTNKLFQCKIVVATLTWANDRFWKMTKTMMKFVWVYDEYQIWVELKLHSMPSSNALCNLFVWELFMKCVKVCISNYKISMSSYDSIYFDNVKKFKYNSMWVCLKKLDWSKSMLSFNS